MLEHLRWTASGRGRSPHRRRGQLCEHLLVVVLLSLSPSSGLSPFSAAPPEPSRNRRCYDCIVLPSPASPNVVLPNCQINVLRRRARTEPSTFARPRRAALGYAALCPSLPDKSSTQSAVHDSDTNETRSPPRERRPDPPSIFAGLRLSREKERVPIARGRFNGHAITGIT